MPPHTTDVARSALSLSLVVPVSNEEGAVDCFMQTVRATFATSPVELDIVFVDDGSQDHTLEALLRLQAEDARIRIVELSRNFGKEAALSAGFQAARGQMVVPLDVDLQDPPEVIFDMIAKWREGYDVVLARRANRDSDTWLKRTSAGCFYRVHNMLADHKIPENVGDFRLLDRSVVEVINNLPESRRFMKGLLSWVGFRTAQVEYTRPERAQGESKYNLWRLWNLALEGITSFSTVPLRMWTYIGMAVAMLSFLYALYITLKVLLLGVDTPGYASLMVVVSFLGGLQLMGIGIVGEYLGRTYLEAKRRPVYVVRRMHEASAVTASQIATGSPAEPTPPSGEAPPQNKA